VALVKISFQVHGQKEISRAFDDYGLQINNLTVPLGRMGDEIIKNVRQQFNSQGVEGLGAPWAPLSARYAAWKLAHFGPKPILVATGDMKRAALNKATAIRVTPRRLVYEIQDDKAGYHQDGTVHMPARPIVAFSEVQRRRAVDRVFSRWLNEVKKEAGLS
jgi:hypothetical protein